MTAQKPRTHPQMSQFPVVLQQGFQDFIDIHRPESHPYVKHGKRSKIPGDTSSEKGAEERGATEYVLEFIRLQILQQDLLLRLKLQELEE